MATLREKLELLLQEPFVTKDERESIRVKLPSLSDKELSDIVAQFEEDKRFAAELAEIVAKSQVPQTPAALSLSDIEDLTAQQLVNPEIAPRILSFLQTAIQDYESDKKLAFLKVLRRHEERSPEVFQDETVGYGYTQALIELRGSMLTKLTEGELLGLFKSHLHALLNSSLIDIGRYLDLYFISENEEVTTGEKHQLLIRVMRENEERIGSKTIIVASDEGMKQPYIKYWIVDYVQFTPPKLQRENIDVERYISEGKNVQHLSKEEKVFLRKVLQLYDYLTYARYEKFTTFPEDVITVPRVSLQVSSTPSAHPREPLPATVPPPTDTDRIKKIDEARARLRETGKEAVVLFFDLLSHPQGMTPATAEELTAGLMILAQDNALERAITDTKIRELFVVYLKTKNAPDLLEGFRLTPTMPKFMSIFFQWVLQDKGKLSENDAAQIAARIASMLKKRGNEKYSRIAYLDAASGDFKWS